MIGKKVGWILGSYSFNLFGISELGLKGSVVCWVVVNFRFTQTPKQHVFRGHDLESWAPNQTTHRREQSWSAFLVLLECHMFSHFHGHSHCCQRSAFRDWDGFFIIYLLGAQAGELNSQINEINEHWLAENGPCSVLTTCNQIQTWFPNHQSFHVED